MAMNTNCFARPWIAEPGLSSKPVLQNAMVRVVGLSGAQKELLSCGISNRGSTESSFVVLNGSRSDRERRTAGSKVLELSR